MDVRYQNLFGDANEELLHKFLKYHKLNPIVFKLFEKYSLEVKEAGRENFSHWMIVNRIRWYTYIETRGCDYKISNDFIALYARMLVYRCPKFEGFFNLKKMKKNRKCSNPSAKNKHLEVDTNA